MMRSALFLTILFGAAALAVGQDAGTPVPDSPSPTEAHAWLEKFEGEWVSVGRPAAEGQGMTEFRGGMTSKMFGEFWVENRMFADMGGVKFDAIQMIGYDPEKKKYVGTWVDTMNSVLWHYEGELDASGKKLSLVADGPSYFDPTKTAKYRDSYEFVSDDKFISRAEMQGEDGEWVLFATAEVTRKGAAKPEAKPKSAPTSQPK